MFNSTLTRKAPLKQKTPLRSTAALRRKSSLRASCSLKRSTSSPKRAKYYSYKPKYKYKSIFTDNLKRCYITGTLSDGSGNIHVHHIFGGANKELSEKYHFLLPLRVDWHDMADYGIHFNRALDLKYKMLCQEYYLEHYGTKEDFIREFKMWWCEDVSASA